MPDRDDDRTELDRDLARLAAATSRLDADDGFTDAVLRAAAAQADPAQAAPAQADLAQPDPAQPDPLARIARATRDVAPDPAFTDAVLRAVRAAPLPARPTVTDGIVRSGRAAVVLTALAAAASVAFVWQAQRQVDAAIMASVDTLEVSE
ncbi:hypothetical protein SOCEGT47_079810 [Sorangium cellulosum]|uniref:Uncharacterized protein n=1 Tax=Sorangium cellulosum TaxID=56 RepID=A0A4P2QE02_SORCE|nr:hypothetical protein [Sorangium cellulosum]AUX27393.1 hypothetical protein SOCEGT47_079810 [Sorangium cellulosum]